MKSETSRNNLKKERDKFNQGQPATAQSRIVFVLFPVTLIIGLAAFLQYNVPSTKQILGVTAAAMEKMDKASVLRNKEAAKEMFYYAYDNYLAHAFPKDELAPISCSGHDTENCRGCLLTFYDALDTLAVLGNRSEFQVYEFSNCAIK